jgi:serine/threonine protein kinase
MASNMPPPPNLGADKVAEQSLNNPNTDGKEKKKPIKEKAVLDEKTAAVLLKKGYEVEYKISAGSFGQVYTARNAKRNSIDAVKIMDLTKLSKSFKEKFLMREIMTLIRIRHPNVLSVYDIFKSQQKIYIFMEFAGGGTLSDQVRKAEGGYLREDKAKFWFRQCTEALHCMHVTHKICHR